MHRHLPRFRKIASVVLAFTFTVATLHAQGLGDRLKKAKDKAAGTTNSSPAASGASSGRASGGDPGRPPDPFTVENQKQYARAAEADSRSWEENRERGTYWHAV